MNATPAFPSPRNVARTFRFRLPCLALVALLAIPFTSRASVDVSVGLAIGVPPPTPRHEVVVARPSGRHVWINGYWYWRGGRYVWAPGHWELPPRRHAVYAPLHWERRGHGYIMIQGTWR